MNSIRATQRLNEAELASATPTNASWHADYRDTAFVYIGGLPFNITEGDVVTIFSQYGNPTYVNLVRDKETGKSKGFCFLRYEDQRSCDLAVDNLGGASVMGRMLRVDHTRYKPKEGEEIVDNTQGEGENGAEEDDQDEDDQEDEREMLQEERDLQRLKLEHDDDDPMKAYLIEQKQEEVTKALERQKRDKKRDGDRSRKHRHHHRDKHDDVRSHRHGDEHRIKRSRSRSPHRHHQDDERHRRKHRSRSPRDESRRHRRHRDEDDSHQSSRRHRARSK